jgi:hypothetical protein
MGTVLLLNVTDVLEDSLSRVTYDSRRLCVSSTLAVIQDDWRQWSAECAPDAGLLFLFLTVGHGVSGQVEDTIRALYAAGHTVVEALDSTEVISDDHSYAARAEARATFRRHRLGSWPGWRDISPYLKYVSESSSGNQMAC